MQKRYLLILLTLVVLIGISGCNFVSSNSKEYRGYYVYDVDTPLVGIEYQCGDKRGITDNKGGFYFLENSDCKFMLGDIQLRYIYSQELSDNMLIQEDNQKVVKFLRALSKDRRGVYIDKATKNAIEILRIKEIPDSNIIFQVTIDAINRYLQKSGNQKLLSSI